MRSALSLLLGVAAAIGAVVARAEDDGPAQHVAALPAPVALGPVYSLDRCIELADRNYPRVHEALARLHKKQADARLARAQPYSDFTLTAGIGPAPSLHGTSVYSPDRDVSLTSDMGLAWQLGVEGTIPLWTFGKITNLWDAADAQITVGEHEVKKEKNEVRLAVRRAYYGVQLARDGLVLLHEATERIGKYVARLEQRVQAGDGDDIELVKMKMYQAQLDVRGSEAVREQRIAMAGLRFLTGVRGTFDIPNEPLARSAHALAPLARYLSAARLFRPEINMARAGIVARTAQLRLERARYYPDIALALSAKWARADLVDDQRNPYVRDDANYLRYGAALVLRYKLDFLPTAARAAQAEAALEEIRATERYALGGVGVEVEKAYEEARDAERRLAAVGRATRFARQWLIKVQQGIDVGTFSDDDVVDPAKEYALQRFAYLNAIFDYNVAIAKLAQVTGWDRMLK
jgi:outer membrane protein TolC